MSNLRVTTWRKSIADSDLPRNARLVAWALSNYMSSDCRHAFPGVERLAHDTSASEKTVRSQLKCLVDNGWLRVTETSNRRGGRATEYAGTVPTSLVRATPFTGKNEPSLPVKRDTLPVKTDSFTGKNDTKTGSVFTAQEDIEEDRKKSLASTAVEAGDFRSVRDAVATACQINLTELTASANGALNAASRAIVGAGGTSAEVARRATQFRRQFPGANVTPSALAKHWPALGRSEGGGSGTSTSTAVLAAHRVNNWGLDLDGAVRYFENNLPAPAAVEEAVATFLALRPDLTAVPKDLAELVTIGGLP
jgi:hypothetical protein